MVLLGLGLGMLNSAGCKQETQTAPASAAATQAGQVYQVRGLVRSLPEPRAKSPQILIEHEAIPAFVDTFGQTVGMKSMTMPFELAPGVKTDDLSVGDKVAFTLRVDWQANQIRITELRKLPMDTPLLPGKQAMPATAAASQP